MHILPNKFMRIRHYGILSSRKKKECINRIRKQLLKNYTEWKILKNKDYQNILLEKYEIDVTKCSKCKKGILTRIIHGFPITKLKHLLNLKMLEIFIPQKWGYI